jgi:hypothetical protein
MIGPITTHASTRNNRKISPAIGLKGYRGNVAEASRVGEQIF